VNIIRYAKTFKTQIKRKKGRVFVHLSLSSMFNDNLREIYHYSPNHFFVSFLVKANSLFYQKSSVKHQWKRKYCTTIPKYFDVSNG